MRHALIAAAAVLTTAPLTGAAQTATTGADSALTLEVRRLIMARLTSFASGDSATFRRLIAPGYVHVYEWGQRQSGPALLRQMASDRTTADYAATGQFTVSEVHARRVGPMLLVDDMVTLRYNPGADLVLSSRLRETHVLVWIDGQWRFAQHSDTPLQTLEGHPTTAALPDSAALGAFVGEYEWPGGDRERITQRGARLYAQDPTHPEEPAHPWVAGGAEAFYPEGDASGLTVFARDTTGRVTHLIGRITGGPLMVAHRIR